MVVSGCDSAYPHMAIHANLVRDQAAGRVIDSDPLARVVASGLWKASGTRLFCHRYVANQVRLALFILAYTPGNFLRRLCLPKAVKHWSSRSVQIKLIKIGGRLVRPPGGWCSSEGLLGLPVQLDFARGASR